MKGETVVLRAVGLRAEAGNHAMRLPELSFTLYAGEFAALFGPSGCGKSRLFGVLTEAVPLLNGKLECTDYSAMPALTLPRAGRATTLAGFLKKQASSWSKAIYLLELFGLGDKMDFPLSVLSTGETACLRIAAAFANPAPLYLLDDPFDLIDFEQRRRLLEEIEDRCRFGSTVFFTTRSPDIAACADRVIMLNEGQITADDTPENLLRETRATRIEIESDQPEQVSQLLAPVEVRIAEHDHGFRLSTFAEDELALQLLREGYGSVRTVFLQQPTLADAWHWFALQNRPRMGSAGGRG